MTCEGCRGDDVYEPTLVERLLAAARNVLSLATPAGVVDKATLWELEDAIKAVEA